MTREDIARVLNLRHWTGGKYRRHDCKCEDCRAIKRVCVAASQFLDQQERRKGIVSGSG